MGTKQKIPLFPTPNPHRQASSLHHSHNPLTTLAYTEPKIIHLRDGEVVLFKRPHSALWQCCYKLADGISSSIMELAQLRLNQAVNINVLKGKIIEPIAPKETRLEDLLSRMTQDNIHTEESFGRPVGKEIL